MVAIPWLKAILDPEYITEVAVHFHMDRYRCLQNFAMRFVHAKRIQGGCI